MPARYLCVSRVGLGNASAQSAGALDENRAARPPRSLRRCRCRRPRRCRNAPGRAGGDARACGARRSPSASPAPRPAHRPRIAVDAGGDVDGKDRASRRRSCARPRRGLAVEIAREPGSEEGVDDEREIAGATRRRHGPRRSNRRPHGRRRPSGAPGFPKERGRPRVPSPAAAAPRRNRRRRCCRDRTGRGRVLGSRASAPPSRPPPRRQAASAYSRASRPRWPGRRRAHFPVVSTGASIASAAKMGFVDQAGASRWLFRATSAFLFRRIAGRWPRFVHG